jgi:hypothetical protein
MIGVVLWSSRLTGVAKRVNLDPSSLPSGTTETAGDARPVLLPVLRIAMGAGRGNGANGSEGTEGECVSGIGEESGTDDFLDNEPDDRGVENVLASHPCFLVLSADSLLGLSPLTGKGIA